MPARAAEHSTDVGWTQVREVCMRIASCFLCLMLCSANSFGQNLLWEMMDDASGGTDVARALTLSTRTAIFIGNASNSADDVNDLVIQSLRRRNGSVLWTDRVPTATGLGLGLQIASHQGRVFAAGYVAGAVASSTDMVIRSYDALHGTLLWNSVWDAGRDDLPQAIVAGPTAVVVVGYGGNVPGQPVNFLVRAYEPGSGLILWEDRVERPDLDSTAAWTVAITRNHVVVAGTTQSTQARDLLLRAYNALSGELVWETTRPSTTPTAIDVVAGRVFLAGSSFNSSYVGALDAKNGEWLWEDDATGPSGGFGDLAVHGQRVVAAGSVGPISCSAPTTRAPGGQSGKISRRRFRRGITIAPVPSSSTPGRSTLLAVAFSPWAPPKCWSGPTVWTARCCGTSLASKRRCAWHIRR